jgi:hypothetical protein
MPTPHDADRFEPLPSLTGLPRWLWRKVPRRARPVLALAMVAALVAIAASIPELVETKREVEAERAEATRRAQAAQRRRVVEDQRPRTARLSAAELLAARRLGGLADPRSAALVAVPLERAITADVRTRARAGLLPGSASTTECSARLERTRDTAGYNCLAVQSSRQALQGRRLATGYRFTARADLAAGVLVWCKENPYPLHPTSHVVKAELESACRGGPAPRGG